MIKSVLSSYGSLAHSYRTALGPNQSDQDGGACFQFLGFDVMLDREARPALIEINRNCSLKCDTPLDSFVKVNAIKQTLQSGTHCSTAAERGAEHSGTLHPVVATRGSCLAILLAVSL